VRVPSVENSLSHARCHRDLVHAHCFDPRLEEQPLGSFQDAFAILRRVSAFRALVQIQSRRAGSVLVGLSLFAVFFFLTLYMQQVLGFTPLQTGFSYLPFTVAIMVASGVGAVLVNRVGVKWLLVAGLLVMAAGLLLMVRLPEHGSYAADILPAFIVTALGAGMVFLPMTNAAVSGADLQDAGLASALLNTSQQVGGAVGLAVLSTIATGYTNTVLAADPRAGFAHALVEGFHRGFIVGACFAVAAAVLALFTISRSVGRVERAPEEEFASSPIQVERKHVEPVTSLIEA
jgi:MFS family permease